MANPRVVVMPVETSLVLDQDGWHLTAAPPAWWLEMTDAGNDELEAGACRGADCPRCKASAGDHGHS